MAQEVALVFCGGETEVRAAMLLAGAANYRPSLAPLTPSMDAAVARPGRTATHSYKQKQHQQRLLISSRQSARARTDVAEAVRHVRGVPDSVIREKVQRVFE